MVSSLLINHEANLAAPQHGAGGLCAILCLRATPKAVQASLSCASENSNFSLPSVISVSIRSVLTFLVTLILRHSFAQVREEEKRRPEISATISSGDTTDPNSSLPLGIHYTLAPDTQSVSLPR